MSGKEYLGDGVYATTNGFEIILTTENGVSTTNAIVLEPAVVVKLVEFIERMFEEKPS